MKAALLHEDDALLYFGANQDERHAAMVTANAVGRALVDPVERDGVRYVKKVRRKAAAREEATA